MKLKIGARKFVKYNKGRYCNKIQKSLPFTKNLHFCNYGLKSLVSGYLTFRQVKAIYNFLKKKLKRKRKPKNKIVLKLIVSFPITKKPTGIRMGKGKGALFSHIVKITAGCLLFELNCISKRLLKTTIIALQKKTSLKLAISTK